MNPTSNSYIRQYMPEQNCHPPQTQAQFVGAAQYQIGLYLKLLRIKIRLVESIKQNQGVCSGYIQLTRYRWYGTEVRTNFYRDGYIYTFLNAS